MLLFDAGPELPEFKSVLFKGPFHPTAPFYLSISHVAQTNESVLFITPSRQSVISALQTYNDGRLASAVYSRSSSRVKILYPGTAAELAVLLSLLQVPKAEDNRAALIDDKIALDATSLIILHEISSYFLSDDNQTRWTISSYASLVTRALSTISRLSPRCVFALFDSQLDRLRLPVLKHISLPAPYAPYDATPSVEPQSVSPIVERYFEWMAVFECANDTRTVKLYRDGHKEHVHRYEWKETVDEQCRVYFEHNSA